MKNSPRLSALLALLILSFSPVTSTAQDDAATAIPAASSVDAAREVRVNDLRELVAEKNAEQIESSLEGWVGLLREAQRGVERAATPEERTAARADLGQVLAITDLLASRLAELGGDAAEARDLVQEIKAGQQEEAQAESQKELTQEEALSLDPSVLAARMRPLDIEETKAALERWQAVLKQKAVELSNVEIANLQAEDAGDSAEVDRLTTRLVALRAERDALRSRFDVVVDAFERKGAAEADVETFRSYADSTVAPVQITGFNAAWVEAREWLLSPEGGLQLGLNIVTFLVILIAFSILARIVANILQRSLKAMKQTSSLLRNFMVNTVRKVIVFIGVVVALGQLGVDIGPFLAAIGAAGFVIGFALQGTLSNFASGVMIMIYRPYDIGDVVNMAGIVGSVDDMTLVSTTMKTFDNQTIVVPNSKIWGDVITNVTANTTRRVDMTFGIGYGDDIQKALDVLTDIVTSHEKVLKTPEPVIKLHELGDSSVNFIVRPWCNAADYWAVHWDITRSVKERFDAAGISIPFPQRDVHLIYENARPEA